MALFTIANKIESKGVILEEEKETEHCAQQPKRHKVTDTGTIETE